MIDDIQVLLPVAHGSEEIEVVIIADILKRAKANVIVASVEKNCEILASQGTKIIADMLINDALDLAHDLILLPVRWKFVFYLSIKILNLKDLRK